MLEYLGPKITPMFKIFLAIVAFMMVFASCSTIRVPTFSEVTLYSRGDSLAYEYISTGQLIGVAAGVLKEGKIIWQNGLGYLDVENQILADSNMVHRLASITKTMTSTAILQLVEKKELELDVPIQNYLPDYPVKPEGTITLRNLLNHTSGTPAYNFFEGRPSKHYNSLSEGTKVFRNRKLKHVPGTQYYYSSYGYTVLGAIIEEVTKLSYQEYMEKYIWTPAGMIHTSTEVYGRSYPNKSRLYEKTKKGFKSGKVTDLSIKYAAGGVQSTVGDMLRFARALLNDKLLLEETKMMAFEVPDLKQENRLAYGLGWIITQDKEFGMWHSHDGHQSGTSTEFIVIPSKNMAVVVLANSTKSNQQVQRLARDLIKLYL